MPVADLADLRAETREVVERYLERTAAGFCRVAPDTAAEALDDVRAHVLETLTADSSPADAEEALAVFGEPDEFAAALCEAVAREGEGVAGFGRTASRTDDDPDHPASGTLLGIPYELRMPTTERVRSSWWNTTDTRLFVPRVFGLGWDLNFGALAVRLGFIRPDDEEEPFESVPVTWLVAALAVPVAITIAMAVTWVLRAPGLPAELPVHWGANGQPDRFAPPAQALGFLMAMAAVPTMWAVYSFGRRRAGGPRALVSAFATLFAVLAGTIFTATVLWADGVGSVWLMPAAVLAGVGAPFLMLVVLARVNRREEWRRDLG